MASPVQRGKGRLAGALKSLVRMGTKCDPIYDT